MFYELKGLNYEALSPAQLRAVAQLKTLEGRITRKEEARKSIEARAKELDKELTELKAKGQTLSKLFSPTARAPHQGEAPGEGA